MRTAALIPTYNERATIVDLVARLQRVADLHVFVLDDSSPDGTADAVREAFSRKDEVEVLVRARKEGLGAAYLAGFRELLARGDFDRVVTLDADGSHVPEEIPDLLRASESSELVLGSRYVPGARTPGLETHRQLLSRGVNRCWRHLAGGSLRDLTSAMRCYRSAALRRALDRGRFSRHYAFLPELALEFLERGFRVSEVPITYRARRAGESKLTLRVCLDALGTLGRSFVSAT